MSAPLYTPPPWRWFGNTKNNDLYLATVGGGRRFVMDFRRWGMAGAQPRFQVMREGSGLMVPASELVTYEVDYRKDVSDIDHPDARLIAAAPELAEALLAYVNATGSGTLFVAGYVALQKAGLIR